MNIWGRILKMWGWKVDITAPWRKKVIICVAPHTSNMDFILGMCAYRSLGRKVNFLMKEFWFFFPLKYLLRALGGIPVPRRRGSALSQHLAEEIRKSDYFNLALTPEGTRSRTEKWRTGFLYIARDAGVPIQLGVLDYRHKEIIIRDEYHPTGDIEADMAAIKNYYRPYLEVGKHPEAFAL